MIAIHVHFFCDSLCQEIQLSVEVATVTHKKGQGHWNAHDFMSQKLCKYHMHANFATDCIKLWTADSLPMNWEPPDQGLSTSSIKHMIRRHDQAREPNTDHYFKKKKKKKHTQENSHTKYKRTWQSMGIKSGTYFVTELETIGVMRCNNMKPETDAQLQCNPSSNINLTTHELHRSFSSNNNNWVFL